MDKSTSSPFSSRLVFSASTVHFAPPDLSALQWSMTRRMLTSRTRVRLGGLSRQFHVVDTKLLARGCIRSTSIGFLIPIQKPDFVARLPELTEFSGVSQACGYYEISDYGTVLILLSDEDSLSPWVNGVGPERYAILLDLPLELDLQLLQRNGSVHIWERAS